MANMGPRVLRDRYRAVAREIDEHRIGQQFLSTGVKHRRIDYRATCLSDVVCRA